MANQMSNDILIQTIKYGTHKSKQEWIEDFKTIGIYVPQFVLDYDREEDTKQTKYYKKNKNTINKKINCKCGGKFTKHNKSAHLQTKKHLKYLKEKAVVEKMMREVITEIVNNVINHL